MLKINRSYVHSYFDESKLIAEKLKEQETQITKIVDILFDAWKNHRWVFLMGNGGSASTATHFASDLAKTVNDDPMHHGIKAIALVDNIPLVSATTNDWGWENLFITQLRNYWMPKSVVIGISVHGGSGKDKVGAWSQNLLRGLQFAKDIGGSTIGFSGFDGGPMKNLVQTCVVVPAESTPHVESFHVVLHHLIVFRLKDLISQTKLSKKKKHSK
jgi:D-sedoheptulose 7-phosphate isomerase